MKSILKQIVLTILGVALMLAWWTLRGPKEDPNRTISQGSIPAQFWEGGPRQLSISVNTTTPSTMRISLEEGAAPEGQDGRWHEAWEKLPAGPKTFSVQFPVAVKSGMLELGADSPNPGDKLEWTVTLDGKVVSQESETLDKPLESGTAMFLQLELEEFFAPSEPGEDS